MCHLSVLQEYCHNWEKYRMHIFRALLCVSLVAASGCSSLPTKGDPVRYATHITEIARITLYHIQTLRTTFPAPNIELSTPSIGGLNAIIHDLGLLDNELRSSHTDHLSQIQADVSSLEGMVRSLALIMECPVQARPPGVQSSSAKEYPHSHFHQTLTTLQRYLETFLLNEDKLKVC